MDSSNNKAFLEGLPELQYSSDVQTSWNNIELGVMSYAKELHQERIDNGHAGTAFIDWWNSCCELLSGRQMVIQDVNFDSANGGEEYIELYNSGPLIVELSGWRINAGNDGQDMIFPKGSLIYPNASVRVYTNKPDSLSFHSKTPIWNNKGDKALLYDHRNILISSWLYGRKAHEEVTITHICFDGKEKYTEADEYAEVANLRNSLIDISNWTLNAGDGKSFCFPLGSRLLPNSKVRVYTNHVEAETGGYSFSSKTAVWNNNGDFATLEDYKKNVVSEYSYGNGCKT